MINLNKFKEKYEYLYIVLLILGMIAQAGFLLFIALVVLPWLIG